jgi:hypothetical protein
LLFANSYTILFWEFYFLPFPVHAQTPWYIEPSCLCYGGFFNRTYEACSKTDRTF